MNEEEEKAKAKAEALHYLRVLRGNAGPYQPEIRKALDLAIDIVNGKE